MTKPSAIFLTALIGLGAGAAVQAADTMLWPFAEKTPRDPALGLLQKVDSIAVKASEPEEKLITIDVKAKAPRPGYTDVTLVNRPRQLNAHIFAFDLRGRPPQAPEEEENPTDVSAGGTYKNAPVSEIKAIEIYAAENCVAYSLVEKKTVECTARVRQDETL